MGDYKSSNLIYSIIPARGGSKGVPGKNLKLLGGYPLIAYSIVASKLSKKIQRTIVSTDFEKIAEVAVHYGAEVPFLRPKEFARDDSPDIEFVLHALNWFYEKEGNIPDYLVHLRPTTPLREPQIIDLAIEEICNRPEATSLRSGHPASESPFKWFLKDEKGYFKSLSTEYSVDECNLPRQVFPTVYIPNGYVDVLKSSFIMASKTLHGNKMIGFVTPVCHEVDTVEDFEYLEFILKKKGSFIWNFLKKNFPPED